MPRKRNERLVWSERVIDAIRATAQPDRTNYRAAGRLLGVSGSVVKRAFHAINETGLDDTSMERIKNYLDRAPMAENVFDREGVSEIDGHEWHIHDYRYLSGQELPGHQENRKYQIIIEGVYQGEKRKFTTSFAWDIDSAFEMAEAMLGMYDEAEIGEVTVRVYDYGE